MLTVLIVIVMPSIILLIKLYFPCGAVKDCQPPAALLLFSVRPNSHVSIVILTSSKLCKYEQEMTANKKRGLG